MCESRKAEEQEGESESESEKEREREIMRDEVRRKWS